MLGHVCVLATDLDFEEYVLWTKQTELAGLSLLSTNRFCESVDGLALLNLEYLIENGHCVDHTVEGTCLLLILSRGQTTFQRFLSQGTTSVKKVSSSQRLSRWRHVCRVLLGGKM